MSDEIFLHSPEDYCSAFLSLLPQGSAWDKNPDSVLSAFILGLSGVWGNQVDAEAYDFLTVECDPRATLQMLDSWETAFGLPDACNLEAQTLSARHTALVNRITFLGQQNRQWYINLAWSLGYQIYITEFSPFMCGVSNCGDTRSLTPDSSPQGDDWRWQIGPPTIRFYWKVYIVGQPLTWFRVGADGGQCGVDPMVIISFASDLECLFRRYKEAHTQIIFDYGELSQTWDTWVYFRCGDQILHGIPNSQVGIDHMFEAVPQPS